MKQKKSTDTPSDNSPKEMQSSQKTFKKSKRITRSSKNNNNCQTLHELFETNFNQKQIFFKNEIINKDQIKIWFEKELNLNSQQREISPFNSYSDINWFISYLVLKLVPFNQSKLQGYRTLIMNAKININLFNPHILYNEVYSMSMQQLKDVCDFILNKKILIKQDLQIIHSFGNWIGMITLQSDRPIFQTKFNLKQQIWTGVQMRFLNNIVLLVCIILKSIKNSTFFTIKNPHINAIIDLLREILQINWVLQSTKNIIRELFLMLKLENSQIHFFGYLQKKMQNKDQIEVLVDYEFLPDLNKLNLYQIVDPSKNFQKFIEFQQILATSIEQTVKDMVTEFSQHILEQVLDTIKILAVQDLLGIDSNEVFISSVQNMFKNLTWNIIASLYLNKLEEKFHQNLKAIFYQQKINKKNEIVYLIQKMSSDNIQYLTILFRDNFLRIGQQKLQNLIWYKKQILDRKNKDQSNQSQRFKDLKWLEDQLPKQLNIQSKSQEIVEVEIYQKLSKEESLKITPYELNPFMLWVKDQTEFYNEWESNVIIDQMIEMDGILSNNSLEKKKKLSKIYHIYQKIKKKLLQLQNNSQAVFTFTEHILKKLFVSVQQNITIQKVKIYRDLLVLFQSQCDDLKIKITKWIFELKLIRPLILIQLTKKGLIKLDLFDQLLKQRIESNQNQGLLDYAIICKNIMIDEKIFEIFIFPKTLNLTISLLQKNSMQSDHLEVIMFLETLLKNINHPHKLTQELQLSSLEPEYQKLQKDVQEYFEILNEDVYKLMASIVNKWISKSSEEQTKKIIIEFHRNLFMNNERTFFLFFCYLFEQGINDSLKKSQKNEIQNFQKQNYDLIDVINSFILKLISTSQNKSQFLEKIMTPFIILFNKFYNLNQDTFNQKPFFYVIFNLIKGVSCFSQSPHQQKFVVIFNQTLHILRPSKFPKFAFAWLHLISDKFLLQNHLQNQETWDFYFKLLIDLLLFLKRDFCRSDFYKEEVQLFLKGILKLFLVIAISYQQFLFFYFYQLLEEIPKELIQLRNILLRIYPAQTELPSPFQQDFWKVQNQIQFREVPELTAIIETRIQASGLDSCLQTYLNLQNHDDPKEKFTKIYKRFFYSEIPQKKYNELLINSFIVYLPTFLFKYASNEKQIVFNIKQNKSFELLIKIFEQKNIELSQLIVDAIMDNLRYPNLVTFYYANFILLYILEFKNSYEVELMITRLLGRIYIHGPHPWGLLFLFFQIITNPIIEGTEFYQQNQTNYQKIVNIVFNSVSSAFEIQQIISLYDIKIKLISC